MPSIPTAAPRRVARRVGPRNLDGGADFGGPQQHKVHHERVKLLVAGCEHGAVGVLENDFNAKLRGGAC